MADKPLEQILNEFRKSFQKDRPRAKTENSADKSPRRKGMLRNFIKNHPVISAAITAGILSAGGAVYSALDLHQRIFNPDKWEYVSEGDAIKYPYDNWFYVERKEIFENGAVLLVADETDLPPSHLEDKESCIDRRFYLKVLGIPEDETKLDVGTHVRISRRKMLDSGRRPKFTYNEYNQLVIEAQYKILDVYK